MGQVDGCVVPGAADPRRRLGRRKDLCARGKEREGAA